jgi:hypothetical protein
MSKWVDAKRHHCGAANISGRMTNRKANYELHAPGR